VCIFTLPTFKNPFSSWRHELKTTAGKYLLVGLALALGLARIPLITAVVVWLVSAGTVLAIERLLRQR